MARVPRRTSEDRRVGDYAPMASCSSVLASRAQAFYPAQLSLNDLYPRFTDARPFMIYDKYDTSTLPALPLFLLSRTRLESAGVRALPVPFDASREEAKIIMDGVNGLLLPGGTPPVPDSAR